MEIDKEEITIKGKTLRVDSLRINDKQIVVTGKLIKIARIKEELYEDIEDPASLIQSLKSSKVRADIFTFWQRLPETHPKFDYYFEWDNFAAIPIKSYDHWLEKQIDRNSRRAVNRSKSSGVDVRKVSPSDEFTKGVVAIFNESPIRQGKKFWHYGKNFEEVKEEIILRDSDSSEFIGAYCNGELIGFIKLIYTKAYANFAQILSTMKDRDKSPTNALLAKSVEICAEKKIPYLVYERFVYGRKGSDSLSEFKRRNGFEKIDVPRYYVPLNMKAKIALKLNLHHGLAGIIPEKLIIVLLDLRKKWYSRKPGRAKESVK